MPAFEPLFVMPVLVSVCISMCIRRLMPGPDVLTLTEATHAVRRSGNRVDIVCAEDITEM